MTASLERKILNELPVGTDDSCLQLPQATESRGGICIEREQKKIRKG